MKKLKINILKDKILRFKLIKNETYNKIIKSILQNNNIKFFKKNYFNFILNKFTAKKKKSSKKINTCIVTGSKHSIISNTNLCRQQTKRYIFLNKYDNLKLFL